MTECKRCGWCCQNVNINVSYSDILRWAKENRLDILNQVSYIDHQDLKKKGFYIAETVLAPRKPCPFLVSEPLPSCSIYETRPRACKEFPQSLDGEKKQSIKCPIKEDFQLNQKTLFNLKKEQSLDFRLAEDRKTNLIEILGKARQVVSLLKEIKQFAEDPPEDLWVNGYGGEKTGWTNVGSTPYLNAQDQPSHYVWTTTKKAEHGDFGFEDHSEGSGTINSVILYVYGQRAGGGNVDFYIWDGTSWTSHIISLDAAWSWKNAVLSELDSWAKIDGAKLYVKAQNTTDRSDVDAAYLLIDYTPTGPVIPTVTTQDATDLGLDSPSAHATLHGTIENTGGENCDERGFDWDYDSGEPYQYSWTETDSYGIGTFEHQITGLTEGVTVYFRAKAHNSIGWGYGGEKSFVAPETGAEGWLTGWSYRKKHTLNAAFGAGVDYQFRIKVYYGDGSDSGEDVYLNSKCRTDLGDIRITQSDGTSVIGGGDEKGWMQEKADSDYAIIWFKLPDDIGSDRDVYVYYGKSDAKWEGEVHGDLANTFIMGTDLKYGPNDSKWYRNDLTKVYTELIEETSQTPAALYKPEGITIIGNHYFVSFLDASEHPYVRKLLRSDASTVLTSADLLDGTRNHIGGIDTDGTYIYICIAENNDAPTTPAKLKRMNPSDLSIYDTLCDSSQIIEGGNEKNHLGVVAVCPDIDRIYMGNWGNDQMYVFDCSGNYRATINPGPIADINGMTYDKSKGIILGSLSTAPTNRIVVLKPSGATLDNLTVIGEFKTQNVNRTSQGIVLFDAEKDSGNADNKIYVFPYLDTDRIYKHETPYPDKTLYIALGGYHIRSLNWKDLGLFAVHCKFKIGGNNRFNFGFGEAWGISTDDFAISHNSDTNINIMMRNDGNNSSDKYVAECPIDTWAELEVALVPASDKVIICVNGTCENDVSATCFPNENMYIGAQTWGSATAPLYLDWIILRKYNDPEPTHGSWGSEEQPFIEKGFSDNGSGSETFGTPFKALPFSEVGGGGDIFVNPYRTMGFPEVGEGIETFQIPLKGMVFSDQSLGSEAFGVFQNKYFADVGEGEDIFSKIITFLKTQFSDVGQGVDEFEIPYKEMKFNEVGSGADVFSNIVLRFFVDTGSGVDVFEIPIQSKSFLDLGDGVDIFNVPYTEMDFSDVGLGTDVFSKILSLLKVGFSDSGYGEDVFSKIIALVLTQFSDSGFGDDVFESPYIEIGFADVGHGTDIFTKFVLTFFVDVGVGSDLFETLFRTMQFVETGEGIDVFDTPYRAMAFSDNGYGADEFSKILAVLKVAFSDVGSGIEVFSIPYKIMGFSEVGIGTDVFKVFLNKLAFPDTGEGLDVFVIPYRDMGFSDSGSGTDIFSIIFKALGFSDVGSGIEVFTIPFKELVFLDSGFGSDVFKVTLFRDFSETGVGTEEFAAELIGWLEKFFSDTGLGTDTFAIVFRTLPFAESGLGIDAFTTPYREMEFLEDGLGTDIFVVVLGKDFSDLGYGVDLFQKQVYGLVPKGFFDSGHGSDVFVILLKGYCFVDSGLGSDSYVIPYKEMEFIESGLGTDIFAVIFRATEFSEIGLGTDLFNRDGELWFADVGHGAEIFSKILTLKTVKFSELGKGTDTFVFLYRGVKFDESGLGIDSFLVPYRELDFEETGEGSDVFVLVYKTKDFSESGLGTETFSTPYMAIGFSDQSLALDLFNKIVTSKKTQFSDLGHGADTFSSIVSGLLRDFIDSGKGTDLFDTPFRDITVRDLGRGLDVFTLIRPQSFFITGIGSDVFWAFRPFFGLLIGSPQILGIKGETETSGITGTISIIPKEGLK